MIGQYDNFQFLLMQKYTLYFCIRRNWKLWHVLIIILKSKKSLQLNIPVNWCCCLYPNRHTDLGVTMALGGATTSGVSGSSSSVWEVQSMSLALLVPDTPVQGASASSPSPSGVELSMWSGGSMGLLARISPGWDRAELQWKKEWRINGCVTQSSDHIGGPYLTFHDYAYGTAWQLMLLLKSQKSHTCTWTPPVAGWCQSNQGGWWCNPQMRWRTSDSSSLLSSPHAFSPCTPLGSFRSPWEVPQFHLWWDQDNR